MTIDQIKAIQQRVGVKADGIFGPISSEAVRAHLKSLMPVDVKWPKPDDVSMRAYYGAPGDESNLTDLMVRGLGVEYDGLLVKTIRCHKRVAVSLLSILEEIAQGPHKSILKQYAGCFNYRTMRGSSRLSKHAWGAAIDLDPEPNGLRRRWPREATMPLGVMEAFARQGWISAGAFWNLDAMHHEATS